MAAEGRDKDGSPCRDPGSGSCNGAIESIATRDTDRVPSLFAKRVLRELDRRGADPLIAALRQHVPACDEARKNLYYFTANRERMAYPTFRAEGLCVSTGVVEGACKSVIGNRLDDYWGRQAPNT